MKIKNINKNLLMLLVILLILICFLYFINKQFIIFNKIENFKNDHLQNPNINHDHNNKKINLSQTRSGIEQYKQNMMDTGALKTINLSHGNKNTSLKLENILDNLLENEIALEKEISQFDSKVKTFSKNEAIKKFDDITDSVSGTVSHLKTYSDTIQNQVNDLGSDPPDHLVNDPNSPDYDPEKATSWWSRNGNTPPYYTGNYIPIGATTCNLPQCLPMS